MKRICPGRRRLRSCGLRLLDLDDHVRAGEDFVGVGGDRRAGVAIGGVVDADALPRVAFHDDVVAVRDEFVHGRRREADAVFQHLDFLRHADAHGSSPVRKRWDEDYAGKRPRRQTSRANS